MLPETFKYSYIGKFKINKWKKIHPANTNLKEKAWSDFTIGR